MNPVTVVNHPHVDIAGGYCARVGNCEYWAIRARWARDYGGLRLLEYRLYSYASELFRERGWRMPKERDFAQEWAALALAEIVNPEWFCTLQPQEQDAKNQVKRMKSKHAMYVGVKADTWRKVWADKYELVYAYAQEMIDKAFRRIWRNQAEL